MKRSTDRILTTHTGSLVRTHAIIEGMKALRLDQPYDPDRLASDIRAGVAEVVQHQLDVGIDIPNDGEYGRRSFMTYVQERISGLEPRAADPDELLQASPWERDDFPEFFAQYAKHVQTLWMLPGIDMSEALKKGSTNQDRFRVTSPISYSGQAALKRDLDNLTDALEGKQVADRFMSAVTPTGRRQERDILEFYSSEREYEYAFADALHEEYQAITDAGFILQIDFATVNPQSLLGRPVVGDQEKQRERELSIELANHALRGIPEDRVRAHFCGGSNNTPHLRDVPLAEYAPLMLKLNAQGYGIEAANPRHEHEWMVWKDLKLPDGKILIPGLVSQSTNVVEHPELVAWRIQNFASVVGKDNLIVGTDCGFSQSWDLIRAHPSVQWAKLKALADGAALASRALWG